MASAVLASRNEQCWGERKAYMRNYPNNPTNNTRITTRFNPNPTHNPYPDPALNLTRNPNSNLILQSHDLKNHLQQKNEPSQRLPPPPSPVFSDLQLSNRKPEGPVLPRVAFHRDYRTFNLASYSRGELKELKKGLMSELQRVRSLLTRIEARPLESRPGSHNPQFRPPSLQVGQHASEPAAEKRTPKGNQQSRSSGFVTRNDKKIKKISGQKRALPFASGPDSKRPVVPESEVKKLADAMMMKCKQILAKLMKLKHASVFSKPVDVQGLKLHDYYQIVKQPMDLGTVKSRLNKKEYQTPLDFASDVRLTFKNALKYNPKGHDVHTLAETMLLKFEELFRPEHQKYETEYKKVMAENLFNQNSDLAKPMPMVEGSDLMGLQPTMVSLPSVQFVALVPSQLQVDKEMVQLRSGKLPKPKVKDPNKRPMTSEEKLKLGSDLENIPQEKMEQMVQIVRKRNPQLLQEGDEIELDIEALDVETLWELDRFVNYHKKTGGKIRRQDLIENASLNEVENSSLNKVLKSPIDESPPPPDVCGQKNKKWDAAEEDVDIGEEIPAINFPPVEIEKDPAGATGGSCSSGSSSSSSDVSSSSSDSDSGSSSGSDSDEDSVQSPYVEAKRTPAT